MDLDISTQNDSYALKQMHQSLKEKNIQQDFL